MKRAVFIRVIGSVGLRYHRLHGSLFGLVWEKVPDANTKHIYKVEQLEVSDPNHAAFNLRQSATTDSPTRGLQSPGKHCLGPTPLLAKSPHHRADDIVVGVSFHLARIMAPMAGAHAPDGEQKIFLGEVAIISRKAGVWCAAW